MTDHRRWWYGRIEHGKPVMDDPLGFQRAKEAMEGKRIRIRLDEPLQSMDLKALRGYFHAVVLPKFAEAAGYTLKPADLKLVKDGLKEQFLTVPTAPNEPVQVRSTESLTQSEYYQFIFNCRQLGAELYHIDIEDPD